jgi:hypothetical protein
MAVDFRNLFFTTTRSDDPINSNTEGDPKPKEQKQVIDFLTLQSLSFPAASAAVTILWQVSVVVVGAAAAPKWVPLGWAGAIVLALFLYQWGDLGTTSKRLGAFVIGIVNSVLLAAAALGINTQVVQAIAP